MNLSEIISISVHPPTPASKIFRTCSSRILCAFIHISLLMCSSSAQMVFTPIQCVPFGDHQILFIDGTLQCYQTFQYVLMAYAVIYTFPFFLVPIFGSYALITGLISISQFCLGCLFPFPFCCYWFYLLVKQNRSQIVDDFNQTTECETVIVSANTSSKKAVIHSLSGPFRTHNRFLCFRSSRLPWEGVLIFRRLIIVIAFTFIYGSRFRMVVILTICVIILVSHVYVKPFKDAMNNVLETQSLSILTILCGFTLMKAVCYGEDYSSYSKSSQFIHKFNITESILILTPVTIVVLATILCVLVRLVFLVLFCVTFGFRKLSDLLNHVTCLLT